MEDQLCELCSSLDVVELLQAEPDGQHPGVPHHFNLLDLASSAESDCKLCNLFYRGILDWLDSEFGIRREEAFEREKNCED